MSSILQTKKLKSNQSNNLIEMYKAKSVVKKILRHKAKEKLKNLKFRKYIRRCTIYIYLFEMNRYFNLFIHE